MIPAEQVQIPAVRQFHWPEMAQHVIPPRPDEVHIWHAFAGESDPDSGWWAAFLSDDERERSARFRHGCSRAEFILGRGLLRLLLASCLGCRPREIRFRYGTFGKPSLAPPDNLRNFHFNLSHTSGHVAIALCRGRKTGLDIESMGSLSDDWPRAAERVLTPGEWKWINALAESDRSAAFYQMWTCKEAYLKATGEGMIDDLAAIEIVVSRDGVHSFVGLPGGCEDIERWKLQTISVPAGLRGALVSEG
jgi:4'-phosphopantetheinyl transferase